MERGLYIAASGMLAEQVRQDQLANDLANASTPGYKADNSEQASFSDLLLWNSSTGAPIGSLSMGSRITHVVTDLTQGPLQSTGDPLDVALNGPGFLAVATGSGVRYTRDGQLMVDGRGRLMHRHRQPRPRHERQADHGRAGVRPHPDLDRPARHRQGGHAHGRHPGRHVADGRHQAGRHPLHRHARRAPGRHDRPAGLPRGLRRPARRGDGRHDRVVPLLRDHASGRSSRSTPSWAAPPTRSAAPPASRPPLSHRSARRLKNRADPPITRRNISGIAHGWTAPQRPTREAPTHLSAPRFLREGLRC